jgi:hypothetical protein
VNAKNQLLLSCPDEHLRRTYVHEAVTNLPFIAKARRFRLIDGFWKFAIRWLPFIAKVEHVRLSDRFWKCAIHWLLFVAFVIGAIVAFSAEQRSAFSFLLSACGTGN